MSPTTRFLERLANAAHEARLDDVVYGFVDTSIGRLLVAQSGAGVCRVAFEEEEPDAVLGMLAGELSPRVVRSHAATSDARHALAHYLDGATKSLELPVDLSLAHSEFRRHVLRTLMGVRRGEVVTYGELAQRSGRSGAARAAGTACATNPIPIIVPCHRVLPVGGKVGNYGGGTERKRFLLDLEGAPHS